MAKLHIDAIVTHEYDIPNHLLSCGMKSELEDFIASKKVDFVNRSIGQCNNSNVHSFIRSGN